MKRFLSLFMVLIFALCTACGHSGTYKTLTPDEAKSMIESNSDAIILDVRTLEEFEKKHIPNALLIPIEDLRKDDFAKIPDKNATILIYCRTGRRANEAAQLLADKGYKNIHAFGGIVDWTGEVEGTEVPVPYKKITQEEAMKILAENPDAKLLDCRFPKDYEARHIPGAINFPLEFAVAENFEKIPDKNAPLITYCGDGNRGKLTAKVLSENGYRNVYTMGGIIEWKGAVEGADVPPAAETDK